MAVSDKSTRNAHPYILLKRYHCQTLPPHAQGGLAPRSTFILLTCYFWQRFCSVTSYLNSQSRTRKYARYVKKWAYMRESERDGDREAGRERDHWCALVVNPTEVSEDPQLICQDLISQDGLQSRAWICAAEGNHRTNISKHVSKQRHAFQPAIPPPPPPPPIPTSHLRAFRRLLRLHWEN